MKAPKRYTITAALPYANGPIHIGHLAGAYLPADTYVRYLRQKEKDVVFIGGSDEHGVPITIRAKKEGVSTQDIVDKYDGMIRKSFKEFGIDFDNYSRTSRPVHYKTASDFFVNLYENNKFSEKVTEQLYDEEAKQFLADRFVVGTCPKCGYEESYGDQCENCGTSHNATDLINARSAITGAKPILKKTRHWFLPLDHYNEWLEKWILEGHKDDWKPNVYGQCKSWLDDGLKPRAVTRDLDWGIPVPVKGGEGKVLYVWFDAPIGYISSTKEWAAKNDKDWALYWKDEDTELINFIGKDNIVFHCIIFPVMLKAHGDYVLPSNVPANEFLNLEGQKLSTSKNWAVWLHEYLEDFPGQQDVLRYVLTANAPETKDNNFSWKDFQTRNNSELVGILGNFINRVVVLTNKYYNGKVPAHLEFTEHDTAALNKIKTISEHTAEFIETFKFRKAQAEMMKLARLGNKYLADEEPWKLKNKDDERVQTIMYVALQLAAALAPLSKPFLPFTAEKLSAMLNMDKDLKWSELSAQKEFLAPNHHIKEASLLFSKIEDKDIQKQLDKLKATKEDNQIDKKEVSPQKETVTFDDFTKLDLRTGEILEAEKVPKADKLLKFKVDTGLDQRTIVSGIAEHYQPEELIGKKVSVVVNLKPIKLRGVLSEGMLLMTENKDGKIVFINPDEKNIPNGEFIN